MSIEFGRIPKPDFDGAHQKLASIEGLLGGYRRNIRIVQTTFFVVNLILLKAFIDNPNLVNALSPIAVSLYNVYQSIKGLRFLNRQTSEIQKIKKDLVGQELQSPGGYLVPIKGRALQELRDKVPTREMVVRNSVRTPDPRNN